MKRNNARVIVTLGSLLTAVTVVNATPYNITIHDNHSAAGYVGTGVGLEDNDTEPGTIKSDAWDLEAFGYDRSTRQLDVIGTFNFRDGAVANARTLHAGAIFIGTGANLPGPNNWSYAYVLDFTSGTYSLYNAFSIVLPTDIPQSSPWTINPTAGAIATGAFTYLTGLSDPDGFGLTVMTPANASSHNMIQLSLDDLSATVLNDFWVHTTMECGNDNLNGRYQHVPDAGASIGLLGLGLAALVAVRRKIVA
ncbi:MAG TPA: VPDSG-CTERM sorting domain-containing protein [Verrucomicrobiae bacterium]|nr:VPDSG-CTERM sorting domain-containing protein [Verrucomicrobiae bacterium]